MNASLQKTGFLYDDRYLRHDTGPGHPECPARLSRTIAYLEKQTWYPDLKQVDAALADESWLLTAHSPEYLERARDFCAKGYTHLDTLDVGISGESYDIARLAAGGALNLADNLMAGEIANGFALLRPPGHHAEAEYAMGFCLFNNITILARYLQKKHGLEKILIMDWDVHHGNGTQHAFEEDPSVFYISTHQYPFYPGTGDAYETGLGRGEGLTLNCPMAQGASDRDYEAAFLEKILPAAHAFKPDAVLISAGFDAHREDPIANINLSTEFFGWMSERMMEIAGQYAKGRLLSLLEGGYHLDYLPLCVGEHLKVLAGARKSA